jgi:hypothetical protein
VWVQVPLRVLTDNFQEIKTSYLTQNESDSFFVLSYFFLKLQVFCRFCLPFGNL